MSAQFEVGDGVVYRAHPDAEPEQGIVTEIRAGGVMVRYSVLGPAKLTPASMLTRLAPFGGAR